MRYLCILVALLCLAFSGVPKASGQPIDQPQAQEYLEGRVQEVVEDARDKINGTTTINQKLQVYIDKGGADTQGKTLTVLNGGFLSPITKIFKVGDEVIVSGIQQNEKTEYFIVDYQRRKALMLMVAAFVGLTILIARWKGVASFLGMIYSFFVIIKFVLPQILSGQNPIVTAVIAAIMIIPVTFYVSHGFNRKTHVAISGTLVTLTLTSIISSLCIEFTKLSGFATEDATFLQLSAVNPINMKGLLMAGIIVGLLGILDDITISQAAIVEKLRQASPSLSPHELFTRAMDVGKDHIGSVINTLILVYAGAALPFMLLFFATPQSFATFVNFEMIAEEVVRTITASMGLVLAVPITTFFAAFKFKK